MNNSTSVYITRPDVPKVAIEMLRDKGYDVTTWTRECPVPKDELMKGISNKNALFCMLTDKIDAQVLNAAGPSLKVVATMSVGYEHLDIEEIKKREILVGYTPGVLTDAVAELTLALLLATSRRLFEANKAIAYNEWNAWSPSWMCGPGLKGKVVGIVGFGRIGQQVGRMLQPFKICSLLYTSRTEKEDGKELHAKKVELDELLKCSDFVIVTCALTSDTKHLFNKAAFEKMKPSAIFINASRGGVVDQDALIEALECNKIAAAGLDVMTPEPIPNDHCLLKMKNCVLLPHIGTANTETRIEMAKLTANNIIAAIEGKPLPQPLQL